MPDTLTFSEPGVQPKRNEQEDYLGLPLTIEWRKGDLKEDKAGHTWYMHADYGFINGSAGNDGEEMDIFLGPDKESQRVFMFPLLKGASHDHVESDTFEDVLDEFKVCLGFPTPADAQRAMLDQYGSSRIGNLTEMSIVDLKGWVTIQAVKARKNTLLLAGEDEGSAPRGDGLRTVIPQLLIEG